MTLDMTWEHREEIIRRDERAEGRLEGRDEGILAGMEQQRRADEILLVAKDNEIEAKDAKIANQAAEITRLKALLNSKA